MNGRLWNVVALSLLSAAVIGLSIYSVAAHRNLEDMRMDETAAREAVFAGIVSSAEKLDAGLAKLSVSEDPHNAAELLADLWRDCTEAAEQVDRVQLGMQDKRALEGFINTVGDYAHSLGARLAETGAISAEDRQQLTEIGKMMSHIAAQLNLARESGYTAEIGIDEFFAERELSFISGEYPRLIYDGPFSESTQSRPPRGLAHYDVTEQKALGIAEEFAQHTLSPAAHTDGEVLPFYNFENADGSVRVSITKQGGAVLYYRKESETDGLSILPTQKRLNEAVQIAAEFLAERGYGQMQAGMEQYYGGYAVLEMIPQTQDGVLLYPDVIKVWINMQSGEVAGMDARNYLMNHSLRDFPQQILSEDEARGRLSDALNVRGSVLAVIPKDDGSERFCYGFFCARDDREFLVFLDAVSGGEEDILLLEKRGDGRRVF